MKIEVTAAAGIHVRLAGAEELPALFGVEKLHELVEPEKVGRLEESGLSRVSGDPGACEACMFGGACTVCVAKVLVAFTSASFGPRFFGTTLGRAILLPKISPRAGLIKPAQLPLSRFRSQHYFLNSGARALRQPNGVHTQDGNASRWFWYRCEAQLQSKVNGKP